MGGIFSLEKDANRRLDGAAACAAAGAADEPVGTSLAEPAVPAREDSVTSLSCVADPASDSGSQGVGAAEVAQST